ncbi:MAG: Flp pilus assembly protein CpaB [Pusillimonas sp.]|nr:Flp pilus assembly protein CpaB [Pusillimonas sp.]
MTRSAIFRSKASISLRTWIILAVAIISGVLAALTARQHLNSRVRQLEEQAAVPTVQRVVAARSLSAGVILDSDHLATRSYPTHLVSSDSVAPEAHLLLVGRVLRVDLQAGDPVLEAHTRYQSEAPFSAQLRAGRRAITMPVDVINSVSGLLNPGDLIDLYVSFDYQRRRITAPLLQGVLVLATGSQIQPASDSNLNNGFSAGSGTPSAGGFSTVTLDTSPEDAVKLVAARQSGTLTAVLRRQDDIEASQRAARGDLASLLGLARPAPYTYARKRAPVIYGNTKARGLPGLHPSPPKNPQASGLFDLPDAQGLTSAWRLADPASSFEPEQEP